MSADFEARLVDARGRNVDSGYLGYQYLPSEMWDGNICRDTREIYRNNFNLSEPLNNQIQTAIRKRFGEFDVDTHWGDDQRFTSDGTRQIVVNERRIAPDIKSLDIVLYGAVEDDDGRLWFGTRYLPVAFDRPDRNAEFELTYAADTQDIVLNRCRIDWWEFYQAGVTAWRAVSQDDPRQQSLGVQVHLDEATDRGVVSIGVDESVPVDYQAMAESDRALDPNGIYDVWAQALNSREVPYMYEGFKNELSAEPGWDADEYDTWPFPIGPTFIDAVENNAVPGDVFNFQTKPLNFAELPTAETELALTGFGLLASTAAAAAAAPALAPVVSALVLYYTGLDIAVELFDSDIDPTDITGNDQTPLQILDPNSHDRVLNGWNPSDGESWLYVHRVPIEVEPNPSQSYDSVVTGLWSRGDLGPGGMEERFDFRTVASPLDAEGGQS